MTIKVYRYRVKNLNGLLNEKARAVNFVWNFLNDTQKHALKWDKKWPSRFDLIKLCAGASKDIGLHSGTIESVCTQYAKSRKQFNKAYLRYRGKKNLGWVPLRGYALTRHKDGFMFSGSLFKVFNSRNLPAGKICDACSFSQDAKGNWFLNIVLETPDCIVLREFSPVGIDLGLKSIASLSNGESITAPQYYRKMQGELAKAQRARKSKRVTAIHSKIANQRRDFLHKLSADIVKRFSFIAVGDVSSSKLAKTKMAKSVSDISWYSFKQMLAYKSIANGAKYVEVNESYSTVTCSSCGSRSGPAGLKGLHIRQWTCSGCGSIHNRDRNAALNILARSGYRTPIEGASV